MGVTYINYKIAECDICGATKQFDPAWSIPGDWNNITDIRGLIRYKCVCPECSECIRDYIEEFKPLPSAQPEWNNHTVACLLADLFGDSCACNFNGIDEWLPEKCEVIDSCPNPVGVACWEQYLKHRAERRTDGQSNADGPD